MQAGDIDEHFVRLEGIKTFLACHANYARIISLCTSGCRLVWI